MTRFLALFLMCFMAFSSQAFATQGIEASCTHNDQYKVFSPVPGQGLLSQTIAQIRARLDAALQPAYNAVITDAQFIKVVGAMVTLMVVIYGLVFALGLIPINAADVATRLVKIACVAILVSPASWAFFNTYVVEFFNGGTDFIIAKINNIAVTNNAALGLLAGPRANNIGFATINGLVVDAPFSPLDDAFHLIFSARMLVTLLAYAFTGPYGLFFAVMLLVAVGAFARMVIDVLWIYLMGLVIRTILLGMAPIFISCILFTRTRHLFDGWLFQIVNTCLQAIFVCIFFGFFSKILEYGLWRVLRIPVCWTPVSTFEGVPQMTHFWRPMVMENGEYVLYSKDWTWNGAMGAAGLFPVSILEMAIFVLTAMLALRFNSVVTNLAKEISGASTSLSPFAGLPSFMSFAGGRIVGVAGAVLGGSWLVNATRGFIGRGAAGVIPAAINLRKGVAPVAGLANNVQTQARERATFERPPVMRNPGDTV